MSELDPIEAHRLTLTPRRDGDVLTIELVGELDMASVEALSAMLQRAERTDAIRIVLDLSRCDYVDSTGLTGLLAAQRRSDQGSDRLRLRNLTGHVAEVVKLTKLDRVLRIE